jgi:type IV pilus assembly protein PilB
MLCPFWPNRGERLTTANHWLVRTAASIGIIKPEQAAAVKGSEKDAIWAEVERLSGLSETDLVARIAEKLRVPAATDMVADPHALKVLPEKLATQYVVLPLRESNSRLTVATADPMDFDAEQALSFVSGRAIDYQLASPRTIERALRDAYSGDSLEALVAGLDESLVSAVVALSDDVVGDDGPQDVEAKPIVKLTAMILTDAIRDGASDIHIQPVGAVGVVRYRIDGVMRNVLQLPLVAVTRILSRIKVLAQMDIANRVRPQDGRAKIAIRDREYDLRVSTVPVSGGEKAVIRVLSPGSTAKIDNLALPKQELERIRRLLHSRDGILAVTGPTGSGKTTTLYAALRELATGETNIVTVEDPIEYRIEGISQVQAEPKRGVTFASALRAVMRQDPDVILIGEMRDEETAGIGVQAAMTGHLVLATLHTNDAVGTIARLVDLGVDRGSLADNVRGALAQRLLRRLCTKCAVPIDQPTPQEKELGALYNVKPKMRAVGCTECKNIGYRGRLPVVEVLIVTPQLQQLIANGANSGDLQRAAIAGGMRPLSEVALEHAQAGTTTLEEVARVIGRAESDPEDEAGSEPFAAATGSAGEAPAAEPEMPHILLVDDDPVTRELARFILGTANYSVTQVADGQEAIDALHEAEPVSLMILDLDMPRVTGLDVLKRIRADRSTAAMPVIVLTGSDSSEGAVMDAGADDYIRKPIDPERLLARVRAVLRRASL